MNSFRVVFRGFLVCLHVLEVRLVLVPMWSFWSSLSKSSIFPGLPSRPGLPFGPAGPSGPCGPAGPCGPLPAWLPGRPGLPCDPLTADGNSKIRMKYSKNPYIRITIFLLSGWQRFLNHGHLTKYFGQNVV